MSPFSSLFTYLQARLPLREERGAVAIEYVLLMTFIAMAILAAVTGLGTRLITKLNAIFP